MPSKLMIDWQRLYILNDQSNMVHV